MGDRARKEAWVTLATNDSYALGCLVLGYSLRRVQTTRQLVVMHTEGVSEAIKGQLQTVFDRLVEVTVLDSEDARNLSLLGRPDLNVTYTKIHCWELTDFEKAVFLDADTLVLQNSDELFDREELSAAPDAGWPDCFNTGVYVYCPSLETYQRLINFAQTTGSFDGGDQGLLNSFYNTWSTEDISKHLPFIYNVVSQAFYSYLPAFTQFREKIKIVHFIGPIKPWHHPFNTATKTVTTMPETGHSQEFLQIWWDLFMELVQPRLDPTLTPFIRYEYVLPSSHPPPPPPPPSPHGMEGSVAPQGEGPASYQVLYPYMPPALDQEFYTPPEPQPPFSPEQASPPPPCPPPVCHHEGQEECSPPPWGQQHRHEAPGGEGWLERASDPHVVDMPIVARSFHPYETHYVEEPFLLMNPDSPPSVVYESSDFELILTEEAEKLAPEEESAQLVISVAGDAVDSSHGVVEGGTSLVSGGINSSPVDASSVGDEDSKSCGAKGKEKAVNSKQIEENGQVGGLVGELAQMKVGASGEGADYVILDDRERRLAWERGHADYLGADRFENIRKKLDEKMAPLPPTSPSAAREPSKRMEASLSEASLTKPQERQFEGPRRLSRQRSLSVGSKRDSAQTAMDPHFRESLDKRLRELFDKQQADDEKQERVEEQLTGTQKPQTVVERLLGCTRKQDVAQEQLADAKKWGTGGENLTDAEKQEALEEKRNQGNVKPN